MINIGEIEELERNISALEVSSALEFIANKYKNQATFSTSFGLEDQAITHLIFSNNIPIKLFTLDTGRLFPETYAVWNRTLDIYKTPIENYFPQADEVQKMVSKKGPLSFYESIENRKECCFIRKVEPLNRALSGNKIWITGIRKEQSQSRKEMKQLEWDEQHQVIKYHPLFNWTLNELKAFISKNNIPYNSLHDKGFASIGCQPCTRAIKEEDDERSGRWWWEDNSKKECGLHEGMSV